MDSLLQSREQVRGLFWNKKKHKKSLMLERVLCMVYEVHVTATPGSVTSYMYLGKHIDGSRRRWSAWGSWWQSAVPSGRAVLKN